MKTTSSKTQGVPPGSSLPAASSLAMIGSLQVVERDEVQLSLFAFLLLLVAFAFFIRRLCLALGASLIRLLFGSVTEPGFADGFVECLLKSICPHDAVGLIDLHRGLWRGLLIELLHHGYNVVEYGGLGRDDKDSRDIVRAE